MLYFMRGKLYVPLRKLRRELLKEMHDTKLAGHPREENTGIACMIIPLAQDEGRRASLCQDMPCLSSRQDRAKKGSRLGVAPTYLGKAMAPEG